MKAKGILMEQHKRYAIIMTRIGTFEKTKPIENGLIGEEVTYELYEPIYWRFFKEKRYSMSFALACILLLLAIPTYFFANGHQAYAYIHIDINPSVELEVDKHWKVHSIHSINEDGLSLINELSNYKGKKADKVIQLVMEKSEQIGLLSNGKSMLIGVSYVKGTSEDEQFFSTLTDQLFIDEWEVSTVYIPTTIREIAKQEKKSMNELVASQIVEAEEENENIQVNETDKKAIESFYQNKQTEKSVNVPQKNMSEEKQTKQPLKIKEKENKKQTKVKFKRSNQHHKMKQNSIENNRNHKYKHNHKEKAKNKAKNKKSQKNNIAKQKKKVQEKNNKSVHKNKGKNIHKFNNGKTYNNKHKNKNHYKQDKKNYGNHKKGSEKNSKKQKGPKHQKKGPENNK